MKTLKLKSPISASILVTNGCDLRCQHCIVKGGDRLTDELTDSEILDLIGQIADADGMAIDFNGGEPLTREAIGSFIDYAFDRGLRVVLTTNGTLITDEWLDRYATKLWLMRVSLDSDDEAVHDAFRGVEGAFASATTNIAGAAERGVNVTVLTTVHRENYKQVPSIAALGESLGARGFFTALLLNAGRGETLSDLVMTPSEVQEFCLQQQVIRGQLRSEGSSFEVFEEIPEVALIADYKHPPAARSCTAAVTSMSITPDGYALPCASFGDCPELKTDSNNVRLWSLVEIWNEAPLFAAVRDRGRVGGKCARCGFAAVCQGGCRIAAYMHSHDLYGEDPWCWHTPQEEAEAT